jgi:hypothetical protein
MIPATTSIAAVARTDPAPLVTTASDGTIPFALSVIAALLGLAVGWVALRGYRRNDSRPMLFVAAGFLLAFWAPPALLLTYLAVDLVATFSPALEESVPTAIAMTGDLSRIAGFVCILWGLAMPGRSGER